MTNSAHSKSKEPPPKNTKGRGPQGRATTKRDEAQNSRGRRKSGKGPFPLFKHEVRKRSVLERILHSGSGGGGKSASLVGGKGPARKPSCYCLSFSRLAGKEDFQRGKKGGGGGAALMIVGGGRGGGGSNSGSFTRRRLKVLRT